MSEIKFVQPQVKLLDSKDSVKEAWIYSHPQDDKAIDARIEDLEQMDLPIIGMRSYNFYVRGSILFRDLTFTMRPISPWARSNRSVKFNPDNIFLSGEYKGIDDEYLFRCMNEVFKGIENGIEVDYIKTKLPMAASTEFVFSMDDRSLITYLRTLKNHCSDLYDVYGKLILQAIGKDESYLTSRKTLDIFDKLSVQKSEYDLVGKNTQELAEIVVGAYKVSNNLMAQFIRQHYSTVKNELYNKIDGKSLHDIVNERCNDKTVVVVYANKNSFKKLLSVRSCYIAQWDKENDESWSTIVGSYVNNLNAYQFKDMLPCHGDRSKCTIVKAVEERVKGTDVNCPCPILLEAPWIVDYRIKRYQSDSTVSNMWSLLARLNLINDNPDNEWRKTYEALINNKD